MATYRVRPSKPVAIFGAVVGIGIIVFGITHVGGKAGGFIYLWVAVGLGIVAFNLWAAFSKNGSVQNITTSGDDNTPPARRGERVEPD